MMECYIWGTPASMPRDSDGDSVYLDSPRADGKYKITGTASSMLGQLDVKRRALLTTWLCDQRRAGVEYRAVRIDQKEHNNKIDDEIIAEIRDRSSWWQTSHAKRKKCAAACIMKQALRAG